jgi:hypothetical protein
MRNRFAGEGKPRASGLIFVLCLAAIPFWAAVAYLDPLAALRPAPHRTGLGTMVEVVPPGLTPMRCQHLEQELRQSRPECAQLLRLRRAPGRSPLGPGDYPLPRRLGVIAGSPDRARLDSAL